MRQLTRLLLLWSTLEQVGFVENCMIIDVDICKPNDESPSMPCATGDKATRDKEGRLIEKIKFLNFRRTLEAYPRKGKKARPCCHNWSWKKNLEKFMDSPHYENVPMQNYCEKQRQKVLADGKYAYHEIKSGSAKKEFLAVCIWTRLLELEPDVAKRFILGSGNGAVCPLYFLRKMNLSNFAALPKEKSHRIPACIYALNKDPIWFMNSPLSTDDGCGRKFHIMAHYQVWSHENKGIANRYRRQGAADTDKCLWSKPTECKSDAPKFPCQKKPKKWPAKIDRIKQRKTYAINYLHEELKYVERNSNRAGCCPVTDFKDMLGRKATRFFLTHKQDYAFSCKRVAQIQHEKLPKKYSLFGNKGIWDWFGFCVTANLLHNGKEKAVKDKLLSIKENNRMCVIRAFDKSQYGNFSQKAVWCAFVKIHFRKDFKTAFGKYCKSPGSEPWPPTYSQHRAALKAKEEKKKAELAKKQAKIEREKEERMEESAPKPVPTTAAPSAAATTKASSSGRSSGRSSRRSSGRSSGRSSRRGGRSSRRSSRRSSGRSSRRSSGRSSRLSRRGGRSKS